ncbi:6-phospho-3-hexuloisomerase [Archaeoglobales archaeon]|nr:MAG: 6-phospho-3-hexuloisomerase [Archaeoglobales archaeon]
MHVEIGMQMGERFIKFLQKIEEHIKILQREIDLNQVKEMIGVIENSESIFVMGAGRSGFIAKAFAMRLMHLGYNVYVVGETVTPRIGKNDVLIAISGSGETTSVVNISRKAKEIVNSKIIAVTNNKNSTLAKLSDVVVLLKGKIKTERNEEIAKIAPLGTMFELTAMIFLDAIIAELMAIKHLTEKDLEAKHAVLE